MMEEQEAMVNQLPEDVLANILQRLAPRCLATSRCVCKPWCTIIDTCRFLRADLLPLCVTGIFINFHDLVLPEFFSRPTTGSTLSTMNYLPVTYSFRHHCNGLLLLWSKNLYVANPATRQWVQLPPRPSPCMGPDNDFIEKEYLVFDPTLSPHYEVFVIPHARVNFFDIKESDPTIEGLEWPPSPFILQVFSSRTKEWEERFFVREGDALGTVADMRLGQELYVRPNAVYWRGVLYVHWQTNFVLRILLKDGKYKVIKLPEYLEPTLCPNLHLGKSKKGVYCSLGDLKIYVLDESDGKMQWVCVGTVHMNHREIDAPGPWTLLDSNHYELPVYSDDSDDEEVIVRQEFEWDSDNDDVIDIRSWGTPCLNDGYRYFTFLGFHPYKEVVFFSDTFRRGLAYHLNSEKVQDLGNIWPKHYDSYTNNPFVSSSFPYTPWMGELVKDGSFSSSS